MAESGVVDVLGFDCLAERTLALAQVKRAADQEAGYDPRLPEYLRRLAPSLKRGLTVVGNFGAANVAAATERTVKELRDAGLGGMRVGSIQGDDVLDLVRGDDIEIPDLGKRLSELGDRVVSANAYVGAQPVIDCLEEGASWVLGGRLADVSLFVGPICWALGWPLDDPAQAAQATMIGHLLECGVQVTGGYFADPPYREVPGQAHLGFPYAEYRDDEWTIRKSGGSGGLVDERVVKLQLAYEVHDPARYLTPDVTADFTNVECRDLGDDQVAVGGARGAPRPETLKVLVGVDLGYRVVAEIGYAGTGCIARAGDAEAIIRSAIDGFGEDVTESRFDLVGVDALAGGTRPETGEPAELRLRVAAYCRTQKTAEALADEVEYLYLGPAGGGGVTRAISRPIGIFPASIARDRVDIVTELIDL